MRKFSIILIFLFSIYYNGFTQSCLPEGIIFTKQSQIDSFQINCPNCTEIEGNVKVHGNDISNLHGLNVLTYIGDNLKIDSNSTLMNLTGLENIKSIGRDLTIYKSHRFVNLKGLNNLTSIGGAFTLILADNMIDLTGLDNLNTVGDSVYIHVRSLRSLNGLNNLTTIGGTLIIKFSYALTNLSALANLTYVGGDFWIEDNIFMVNLTGLNNLTSIGGDLYIEDMDRLVNLTGLNNVTNINGSIHIEGNNLLTSLTGLENINAGSINKLHIFDNTILSKCEIKSICDYLVSPNGKIVIQDNAPGCNSLEEIKGACESPCLSEGITFTTQAQINNFQNDYPGCTDIEGDVEIVSKNGISITDISGLNKLTSIKGNLIIKENELLIRLKGLESLTFIGGSLSILNNPIIEDLSGLDNLTSVGSNLMISQNTNLINFSGLNNLTYIGTNFTIKENSNLGDLKDLKYLTFIGGNLIIEKNQNLKSLMGIDNIDISYIENLSIHDNGSLSYCEVLSMCNMISFSDGNVEIYNNATGCNNPDEIANACGVDISDNIGILRKESEIKDLQIKQSRILLFGMGFIIVIIGLMALLFIRLNKVRAHHKSVLLEQKLLRLQMNPHFIFNVQSNILNLINKNDNNSASRYLTKFSRLLRTTLESSRSDTIYLDDEVSMIMDYLEMQKLLYDNRFEYNVQVDEKLDTEDVTIPPMLIQPFIENAIQHGIKHKDAIGHIIVKFIVKGNMLSCEIEDDGVGREKAWEAEYKERKTHKSLATEIISDRIKVINKKLKQKITMNIIDLKSDNNQPMGTRVILNLPL